MKRLERGIAARMLVLIPLIIVASVSKGALRWLLFLLALGLVVSIFVRPRAARPEYLTVTINEYCLSGGQLRIAGILSNSGTLDIYRPELNFRLEDERGRALANHSVWPTGQLKRIVSIGQSTDFSLTLPAPPNPRTARLSVRSPQYPFSLTMACDQNADVPVLRAIL